MFDQISGKIIRSAPHLEGIDIERLPEFLSKMYTQIVDLRRKFLDPDFVLDEENKLSLENLWRMAHTYSVLSVGGELTPAQKEGAAFVAGNAFNLVDHASSIGAIKIGNTETLTNYTIPPVLLASLLFIVAEQPADAFEASSRMDLENESLSSINILSQALFHLVRGNLDELSRLPESEVATHKVVDSLLEFEEYAYEVLWDKILKAIRKLSTILLSFDNAKRGTSWQRQLEDVIALSLANIEIKGVDLHFQSSYAAPYHLAELLREVGNRLVQRAVVNIPTPAGLNEDSWKQYLKSVSRKRPYLWKNHFKAIEKGFLNPGTSSVIAFPTGSGKSTITEFKIVSCILRNKKVVFLTPTKALVDQVERDLNKNIGSFFNEEVVIGSTIEDGFFIDLDEGFKKVAVMTPERCLSILGTETETFSEVGLIVFDECHLLHGGDEYISRRALDSMVALLKLIAIPQEVPDVLLASAMIENAEELASWLSNILETECLTLDMRWKPTRQARGCVVYNQGRISELEQLIHDALSKATTKTPPKALKNQLSVNPKGLFCLKQTWNTRNSEDYTKVDLLGNDILLSAAGKIPFWHLTPNRNRVASLIGKMFAELRIKTLIFAASPKDAFSIAKQSATLIEDSLDTVYEPDEIKLVAICKAEIGDEKNVYELMAKKTACHHGLLILPERRLAERLFKRKSGINLLAATPTLAQGMNLPVEVVILAGDDRFDRRTDSREMLKAHELLNASGRAGRAGWIATGIVILVPSEIITIQDTEEEITLGSHWFKLQELIYSQEDQCLRIIDPIDMCLDALQSNGDENRAICDYFIQRLPMSKNEKEDAATTFLKKSLGAYIAKKNKEEAFFLSKVKMAIEQKKAILYPDKTEVWEETLSSETGVPLKVIAEISSDLRDIDVDMTSLQWVDHICDWIASNNTYIGLLFDEPELVGTFRGRIKGNSITPQKIIDELKSVLNIWMMGSSLTTIEDHLFSSEKMCKTARKFVIRQLPRISFVFGLFPLVYKKLIEYEGQSEKMPASLGALAGCIRDGFDIPEKLALYQILIKRQPTSRVLVHNDFDRLKFDSPPNNEVESFEEMRKRVFEVWRSK
ncbi:MAG: DEAD/DEAH box helicase [Planctomycetes bacterium]|nr:DEAD/DEAH box helicase [Planctomycetota bacterium]